MHQGLAIAVSMFALAVGSTLTWADTEPPLLTGFDFTPTTVDVTTGPEDVTCTMVLTDDVSGAGWAQCSFYSPSGTQQRACQAHNPVSGSAFDGTWTCAVAIPQYSEEGTWTAQVSVCDEVSNCDSYSTSELQGLSLPTNLEVVSLQDATPPVLTGFDFTPTTVDVTTGPEDVTCTMVLTDDVSGAGWAQCSFYSPSGTQQRACQAHNPVSGSAFDGTWTCAVAIPQYSEEGTWTAQVSVCDEVSNCDSYSTSELQGLSLPTNLEVVSLQDATPPVLTGFDFTPTTVDVTTGPEDVTCTMVLTDDVSGAGWTQCSFYSPSGTQQRACQAHNPVSGSAFDGTWTCAVAIPQYSEEGTWTAQVSVCDEVSNCDSYAASELGQLGMPSALNVGFVGGVPRAAIRSPRDGVRIRGNSVTIRAELIQGSPDGVSPTLGVRFEYRQLPMGDFVQILAASNRHPNPDTTYPYFIHWSLTSISDGDYELRAVAHDLLGNPDPNPETVTVTVDHAGPVDIDENVNLDGRQENQTAVENLIVGVIDSGDLEEASTATSLTLPPGALFFSTDTAVLLYPDPIGEMGALEQPEQSIGAFVDLSLQSGQVDLESGQLGDLNVSYLDANQDGVVDGTSIREEDLRLRQYDSASGSYIVIPAIVLTEHNMLHADVSSLGKFAVAGPLQPRIAAAADKQSVTWGAVSTAASYNTYRGNLADLTDNSDDGLPDSGYGECQNHLDNDVTDTVFSDPETPPGGAGFFYVVAFVDGTGESGLGNTSAGFRREVELTCP